jgi:type I restriction enzyme S subunit
VNLVHRVEGARGLRRFKPYPAYKDSGVEWLGEIPAHWQAKRLKTIADVQLSNVDKKSLEGQEPVRLCNYTDVYYHERITDDFDFMVATATPAQVRRFTLRAGDVLITKDSESWTDIAVPAVVAQDLPGVLCGYHLAHIRPKRACHGPFLARAFSAVGPRDQFEVAADGITRFGLGGDAIATGVFAMPPEPEQRAIAAFLDRETARIDALVAKKERLIELLQEQRTALITRAVTKGLDPNVPMKDSGVEWLGEIPAHWEVKKIGHVARVVRGASPRPAGDPSYFGGDAVPWIAVADLTKDTSKYLLETESYLTQEGEQQSRRVEDNTLLLTNSGATLGVPKITKISGCINDGSVAFIDLATSVRIDYLYWFLASMTDNFRERIKQGSGQPNLNTDIVRSTPIPICPPEEQEEIVDLIESQTARIDSLIRIICDAIDRLKEFRTALISAAVTGKIDVREGAA